MRLLDTQTQELKSFAKSESSWGPDSSGLIPRYAILSHTWENDEVLFADISSQARDWVKKAGGDKVLRSCQLAKSEGYQYIWIDTCCIDKSSSAELSEAINSMFDWYMKAEVCYVYLTDHDVASSHSIIDECRWFRRGWTLQELIAPTYVNFYDKDWNFVNDKISMSSKLSTITRIDESLLRCGHTLHPPLLKHHDMTPGFEDGTYSRGECSCGRNYSVNRLSQLQAYCVAQKMSWASTRKTTRVEDEAYCLMGLFGVNMPLLYGEGRRRAFFRLQKEILENTQDQSILALDFYSGDGRSTALASRPNQFLNCGNIHFRRELTRAAKENRFYSTTMDLTKFGVDVELLIVPEIPSPDRPKVSWFGILDLQMGNNSLARPAIPLELIEDKSPAVCLRAEGLFEVSPERPQHARDVECLVLPESLKYRPDRELDVKALRRQKVTILQNFQELDRKMNREGLHTPIRCVSNSHGCQPFAVECEDGDSVIMHKPGYPRLLVHTWQTGSITGYSSMIYRLGSIFSSDGPYDTEHTGIILKELKSFKCRQIIAGLRELQGTSSSQVPSFILHYFEDNPGNFLVVPGQPDLKVEVKVTRRQFLDWTAPEITVITTQVG